MSRRAAGYSSLQRHLDSSASYSALSTSVSESQTAILTAQLSTFQSALSTFSSLHRSKILSDPSFRTHFSQLCAELGVDPLGGGQKGLWDKMGVGDWYYALGVQVVDVCLKARERGGGLVPMEQVLREVMKLRRGGKDIAAGGAQATTEVTEGDIQRAIEALEPLGCGYEILSLASSGGKKVIRCSPGGLDRDSLVVVEAASSTGRGCVTRDELRAFSAGWEMERVNRALEKALMDDGMVWVDEQVGGLGEADREYWAPGLFVME
jgi:ESCRT-II complex subunit VPS22